MTESGFVSARKVSSSVHLFIHLFGVLHRFQHCTGHITMGSWKGRGNQYIQFVRVLYCKLLTNGKQLSAFPLEAMPGTEPRPQRWEAVISANRQGILYKFHLNPLRTLNVDQQSKVYSSLPRLLSSHRQPCMAMLHSFSIVELNLLYKTDLQHLKYYV